MSNLFRPSPYTGDPVPINPNPPEPKIEPTRQQNTEGDLRKATDSWIEANPKTYKLFEKFALELAGAGRRFGIGLIAERVRYECAIKDYHVYKINNNYRAFIARRLILDHPRLNNYISLRETKY